MAKAAPKSKKARTIKDEHQKKADSPEKPKKQGRVKDFIKKLFRPFRFLRYIVPPYFRNSWKELRLVTWPSRKDTLKLTSAVFIFAIVFAALITVVDYGLDKLFREILLK